MELNQDGFLSEGTVEVLYNAVPELQFVSFGQDESVEDVGPTWTCLLEQPQPVELLELEAAAVPSATAVVPELRNWPGPFTFSVKVPPGETEGRERCNWVVSKSLKSVYCGSLNGNTPTRVPFHIVCSAVEPGLFVRVVLVYTVPGEEARSVTRCNTHKRLEEASNQGGVNLAEHVVRCEDTQAVYDVDECSKRYSVRVPLNQPQAGEDFFKMQLGFVCKNSCFGGMNRRETSIIFSLERAGGQVIGRCSMGIRICSRPKRDKEKAKEKAKKNAEEISGDEELKEECPPLPSGTRIQKKLLKRLSRRGPSKIETKKQTHFWWPKASLGGMSKILLLTQQLKGTGDQQLSDTLKRFLEQHEHREEQG